MFKQKSTFWFAVSSLTLLVCIAILMGCESKSVQDDDTSDQAAVTVTVTPSSVAISGYAIVEARVASGSTYLADRIVTFTVEPSGAGSFSPSVDTTDADGAAVATFTAATAGTATIRATVSGLDISATGSVTITETPAEGTGNVAMTVNPSLLIANGTDTSRVTIVVHDGAGEPAPDSTVVRLTAGEKFVDVDGNGYWSAGIDSLVYDVNENGTWDAVGLIPSSAFTSGGTGTAVVSYIAGSEAQTIYVLATVDDGGIQGYAEKSIQLNPNAAIQSIFLASDSMNLVVKATGGIETAWLRATCYDIWGNPVPEGLTVTFAILDGPDGGEFVGTIEGLDTASALTNSQGLASVPIHSGTVSGTIRIRAQATDPLYGVILSNATQVMVSSGPPAYVVVGVENCNVDYWDNVAYTQIVTAMVSDIYHNPVVDSTVVYFTCEEGMIKSHEERTMEGEGLAYTTWYSGLNTDSTRDPGVVWIYAETAGGTVSDSTFFVNSHILDSLIAFGMPTSMPADGETKFTVTVYGFDLNGNPLIDGTPFEADATFLELAGGTFTNGCYESKATIKLTAPVLKADYSLTGADDDSIGAVERVIWYSNYSSSYFYIDLTTGKAYAKNCELDAATSVSKNGILNVSAIIKDYFGNPLGDHTMYLEIVPDTGTIVGGTAETGSYGEASGMSWRAPADTITVTILLHDMDARGGITLSKAVKVQ